MVGAMNHLARTTRDIQSESPLYDDVRNAEWLMSNLGLMSGPAAEEVTLAQETWDYPDGTIRSRREVKVTLPGVEMLRAVLLEQG